MKKSFTILFLLALLVTPLILAEENTSALMGGIDKKTENILERPATLPQILEGPLKTIFGMKEDATWQQLIVVLGVWIGFFILILNIAGLMPFLKEGWIKILSSLIITALVSITGALDRVVVFFFDIAGLFSWTASWGPLRMIIAIILAVAFIYAFNKVANMIKKKTTISEAEQIGKNFRKGSKDAETFSKAQEKLTQEN